MFSGVFQLCSSPLVGLGEARQGILCSGIENHTLEHNVVLDFRTPSLHPGDSVGV